jgi:tetratricopeptide (TPR) repeat protein
LNRYSSFAEKAEIMGASQHFRRLWCWIRISCLAGLATCLGCTRTPEQFPGDQEFSAGCKSLTAGHLEEAAKALDIAIEKNPTYAMAYYYRAVVRQRLGRTDDAIKDYGKSLLYDPDLADAYCGRGEAYLEKRCFELAIDDLSKAIELGRVYKAYSLRTQANLLLENYDDAVDDAHAAIRLNPEGGLAMNASAPRLAPLPNQQPAGPPPNQQPAGPVEYVIAAIELNMPASEEAKSALAQAYSDWGNRMQRDGNPWQAKKASGEAKQLQPGYSKLQVAYEAINLRSGIPLPREVGYLPAALPDFKSQAFQKLNQGDLRGATDDFTQILDTDPNCADAWVWYGRGAAFLENHDADSAIPDFDKAIHCAPDFALAYFRRGQAYLSKGNCQPAIADTTVAIGLQPNNAQAYFYRAQARSLDGSPGLALADLDTAVGLNPRLSAVGSSLYADIYEGQAKKYRAESKWDKAIAALRKAIEYGNRIVPPDRGRMERLSSQIAAGYCGLAAGSVAAERGDEAIASLKQAIDNLERMLPFSSNNADTLTAELARAYQEMGSACLAARHWDEAISSLEKAVSLQKSRAAEIDPQLSLACGEQGFQYATGGDFPKAIKYLRRARDLNRFGAQTYRLCGLTNCVMARYYHDHGPMADEKAQWRAAVNNLSEAIRLEPHTEPDLAKWLAEARYHLDRLAAQPLAAQPLAAQPLAAN